MWFNSYHQYLLISKVVLLWWGPSGSRVYCWPSRARGKRPREAHQPRSDIHVINQTNKCQICPTVPCWQAHLHNELGSPVQLQNVTHQGWESWSQSPPLPSLAPSSDCTSKASCTCVDAQPAHPSTIYTPANSCHWTATTVHTPVVRAALGGLWPRGQGAPGWGALWTHALAPWVSWAMAASEARVGPPLEQGPLSPWPGVVLTTPTNGG